MYPFFKKYYKVLLLFIAISLIVYIPLFKEGFPLGHDFSLEVIRLIEYREALFTQIFPRLGAELYMGYGSPIFVFYAPLFLFLTSILSVPFGFLTAIKIVVFILGIGGTFSFFMFLRKTLSTNASILGALLFTVTPYKFIDLFSRNAFAEYTAFMILPLVLWMTILVIEEPNSKKYGLFFCTLILFLLSHNITVMISMPFIAALALVIFKNKYLTYNRISFYNIVIFTLLAIGSASFFLLPAVLEGSLVQMNDLVTGKFAYHRNFLDVIASMFDVKTLIFISPAVILLPIMNAAILLKEKRSYITHPGGLFAFTAGSICFLLMLPISDWVWNLLPVLHLVQFPWRFMVVFSLFALWNSSYIFEIIFQQRKKTGYAFIVITTSILIFSHLWHFKDWDYFSEVLPEPPRIALENKRTTVGNEYLTAKMREEPSSLSEKDMYLVPGEKHTYKKCLLDTTVEKSITFPLYYFSYWRAYVGEREVQIDARYPLVTVQLSEPSCVVLRLDFSNIQKISLAITLLSLTLYAGFLLYVSKVKQP